MISFFVEGVPMPKGSGVRKLVPANCPNCDSRISLKDGIGRLGPMIESADMKMKSGGSGRLKKWTAAVKFAAEQAMEERELFPGDACLVLETIFGFRRPDTHYTKSGATKSSAPMAPNTMSVGDHDKLQRAMADALEGIVYENDARVIWGTPLKIFAPPDCRAGATVIVRRIGFQELYRAETEYRELAAPVGQVELFLQGAGA